MTFVKFALVVDSSGHHRTTLNEGAGDLFLLKICPAHRWTAPSKTLLGRKLGFGGKQAK